MAKILLPVLAVDDNEVAANFFVEQFRSYSEHLINALEATYELTYVTSNEEAAQLLGEDSGIRLALALNSSSADPVEASGFLQVGETKGSKVEGSDCDPQQMQMSATGHWA